jgi:hypothetical protein
VIGAVDSISANLQDPSQTAGPSQDAVTASPGCGNPTALAARRPGEVVRE